MSELGEIFTDPSERQYWPGDARAVWQVHAKMVADKLEEKVGYGNAWVRQGYMGNLARVLSKADRLRNLMWSDLKEPGTSTAASDAEDETVRDTLIDLSAMCALMIANIEEGNRWGR